MKYLILLVNVILKHLSLLKSLHTNIYNLKQINNYDRKTKGWATKKRANKDYNL